jgi:hypothetical protein
LTQTVIDTGPSYGSYDLVILEQLWPAQVDDDIRWGGNKGRNRPDGSDGTHLAGYDLYRQSQIRSSWSISFWPLTRHGHDAIQSTYVQVPYQLAVHPHGQPANRSGRTELHSAAAKRRQKKKKKKRGSPTAYRDFVSSLPSRSDRCLGHATIMRRFNAWGERGNAFNNTCRITHFTFTHIPQIGHVYVCMYVLLLTRVCVSPANIARAFVSFRQTRDGARIHMEKKTRQAGVVFSACHHAAKRY